MTTRNDEEILDPLIRAKDLDAARSGSEVLRGVLGQSAGLVKEKWSLEVDARDRELIVLKIWDWTGAVEYKFAPQELDNFSHLERRLYRLWGDLLQVRSHVQTDDYISGLQSQGAL